LALSDRTATLSISRSDGARWQIELAGVRYLKADEFREGNIIFEVEITVGCAPSREVLETLVSRPHEAAAPEYQDKYRAHIDALIEDVGTGRLTLVSLSSSYGCELIALCERASGTEVR
jgi:hypothetical protein